VPGDNREFNGYDNKDDSYLLEWDFAPPARRRSTAAPKIGEADLPGSASIRGFTHPHFYSHVSATVGAVRDLRLPAWAASASAATSLVPR
jgi:hypothetical protein